MKYLARQFREDRYFKYPKIMINTFDNLVFFLFENYTYDLTSRPIFVSWNVTDIVYENTKL